MDGDELGRAFAAAHDLAREVAGHVPQRLDQQRVVVARDRHAGRPGRQREHAVVGRAFAVDRDRVERLVDHAPERAREHERLDTGVGRQEAEHRRHARLDHAGALRHAADADRALGRGDLDRARLRERIGRHDRAHRRVVSAIAAPERVRRPR